MRVLRMASWEEGGPIPSHDTPHVSLEKLHPVETRDTSGHKQSNTNTKHSNTPHVSVEKLHSFETRNSSRHKETNTDINSHTLKHSHTQTDTMLDSWCQCVRVAVAWDQRHRQTIIIAHIFTIRKRKKTKSEKERLCMLMSSGRSYICFLC